MAETTNPKSVEELTKSVQNCGGWCLWIAGMTLVNVLLTFSGSDTSFVLGVVAGQVATQMAVGAGPIGQALAVGLNVAAIVLFAVMGIWARRGNRWAFVVAFVAYALDSLLLLLAPSVVAIGFHGWALFSLGIGYVAAGALTRARAAEAAGTPLSTSQAFSQPGEGTSPENVDRAARETEEMVRALFATKHEWREVDPKEYPRVDHRFYKNTMKALETEGFRHLGDYEVADLKGTANDPGCFIRAATSDDGTVTAGIFHVCPAKWWMRVLVWFMNRGGLKTLDLETEFSDGSFCCTGMMSMAAAMKYPPQIDQKHFPKNTPPATLLARHRERVMARLDTRPDLSVRPVFTLAECQASQGRQDAIKAAFRKEVGGMTREELLALANTPAKREAAELLWARLQERKQARSVEPPPISR